MADEKFSVWDKAVECLRSKPGKKFTTAEVAEWIIKSYPEECEDKYNRSEQKGKQSKKAIIRAQASNGLKTHAGKSGGDIQYARGGKDSSGKRTVLHFWHLKESAARSGQSYSPQKKKGEKAPTKKAPSSPSQSIDNEAKLYPKLTQYLNSGKIPISSKRIAEGSGSNTGEKGTNEWLYPDVVGMQDLRRRWEKSVQECVDAYSRKQVKLWSFEVKRTINRANVRRCFFQAVSNSSWANYGYLVAAQLEENAKDELQILSALHGIGFIKLASQQPKKSTIVIPARERDSIDWDTVNRLAKESGDFKSFIELITSCLHVGTSEASWD